MSALTIQRLTDLLKPFEPLVSEELAGKLLLYLDLLTKWNAKTNLTSIREPEEIVRRHFGESLFVARHVPAQARTLLDIGSGAGFPGLPIALRIPGLSVTLAESQGKKAAFLQEAVRQLGVPAEVWPKRVESLPPDRLFDVVTLRAVDDTDRALEAARGRIAGGGCLLHLAASEPGADEVVIPGSARSVLRIVRI